MTWYRKLLGLPEKSDELYKSKESEPEETLEQWRERVKDMFLKKHGSKITEDPCITYILNYCVHCNGFSPKECYNRNGSINTDVILTCSKLRLNNKLLQKK